MMELQRGQKISVQTVCRSWTLEVELRHEGPLTVDVSCFGLDGAGHLSDERYFLFYNQRRTPDGAMVLAEGPSAGTARFQIDLAALPDQIQRLSFTAAVDGSQTLRELTRGSIRLLARGEEAVRYAYTGGEFQGERAIVAGELYRKNGDWKFSAVGRGFNGGLRALVESFGGVVADPAPPPPPPSRPAPAPSRQGHAGGAAPSVGEILRALPPRGIWSFWRRCTNPPSAPWPGSPRRRSGSSLRSCARMPPGPCLTFTGPGTCSRSLTSSLPCPPP